MKIKHYIAVAVVAMTTFLACAQTFESNGITFRITGDGTASVTRGTYRGVVNIPSTVYCNGENYAVTSIDNFAMTRSGVTHVTVPSSITEIGVGAWEGAQDLEEVVLPETLAELPDRAFKETALSALIVPNGVKRLGRDALSNCTRLQWLFLPASLEIIDEGALDCCFALTELHCAAIVPPTAGDALRTLNGTDIITAADSLVTAYSNSEEWGDLTRADYYEAFAPEMEFDIEGEVTDDNRFLATMPTGVAYRITDDDGNLIGVTAAEHIYLPIARRDVDYFITPTTHTAMGAPLSVRVKHNSFVPSQAEDILEDIENRSEPLIYASGGVIYITGDNHNEWISIYDVYGTLWYYRPAITGNIGTLPAGKVYIVRVGDTVKKILL